ncbi:electron transfer flavoprotein subunit beta/FixA family protein [Chloroflexota bacterium]
MSLRIIVCVKQVPEPEYYSRLKLDPNKFTLIREGVPSITNPCDRNALEEALRIREKYSGEVIALSMGPPQAFDTLDEALAMGADKAVLLCDSALAGGDTLATAYALCYGMRKLGDYDLILCGNESADGATGQVGPQVAEFLGIPHITRATSIEFVSERSVRVKSAIEYGYLQIDLQLPAVITVSKDINACRLPTVKGILEVASKETHKWDCKQLEADLTKLGLQGSPTQVIGVTKQETERRKEILQGTPEEMAHKAVQRLHELGAI